MNIALRRTMTVDDYLAWAATQSEASRCELINGQVVFTSPELIQHTRLKKRIVFALEHEIQRLAIEAEVFMDGVTIPIEPYTAYEPDASVRLGPPVSGKEMKFSDPFIVVEVISPSSAHSDTSAKLIGYVKLASVRHYLVIDPEARTLTHHARSEAGVITSQTVASGRIDLTPTGIAIDVGVLFR